MESIDQYNPCKLACDGQRRWQPIQYRYRVWGPQKLTLHGIVTDPSGLQHIIDGPETFGLNILKGLADLRGVYRIYPVASAKLQNLVYPRRFTSL